MLEGRAKKRLKFYYKRKISVKFRIINKNPGKIQGTIVHWGTDGIFTNKDPYLVIQDDDKPEMKVYLDEIEDDSIIPVGVELK